MAEIGAAQVRQLQTLRRVWEAETAPSYDLLAISEADLVACEEGSARIPATTPLDVAHPLRRPLKDSFNPRFAQNAAPKCDAVQGYPTSSQRRLNNCAIEMAHFSRCLSKIVATAIMRLTECIAHARMAHGSACKG